MKLSASKFTSFHVNTITPASYKTLGVTEGMQNGESVTINTIDYGMKDHYVIFVNTQIGYNAIVQIRYGNASVVHETFEDYYSFSVAASSDLLTVTLKYTGTRNTKLSYRVL